MDSVGLKQANYSTTENDNKRDLVIKPIPFAEKDFKFGRRVSFSYCDLQNSKK